MPTPKCEMLGPQSCAPLLHSLLLCLPPCRAKHYTRCSQPAMSALSKPEPSRSLQVEILDLRHFSSVDLRPLLEDEVQEWSRVLSWDYSGSAEMILRYVDAKILPGYAAIERGRIVGYSFFVYEGSKGVIGDLFVADGNWASDGVDIETRLLTHVIETLQQSPGIHRVEAQLLVHDSGEVFAPFLQQGFSRP